MMKQAAWRRRIGWRHWAWPLLAMVAVVLTAFMQPLAPIGPEPSWLDWLRYPPEINPRSRLPALASGLTSVAIAADGRHAIAVGTNGTVLISDDGGARWRPQNRGIANLHSVAITPDGRHAIAVGTKGTILVSEDGGAHWQEQTQGSNNLRSIALAADGKHAIAVGIRGTVLVSQDGGVGWQRHPQDRDYFRSVAIAADGQKVIAVGAGGTILVSDDGGARWRTQNRGIANLRSVAITPDGRQAIAVGDNGTVLLSDDGGVHWRLQTNGSDFPISVAIAADGQKAIAVGGDGTIFVSDDGGARWQGQTQGSDQFSSVAITPDGRHAIAVGINGTVLVSDDGGAHWGVQSQSSETLHSVAIAPDGHHAIAVGNDGTMLTSEDGGAHWRAQRQDTDYLGSVAIAADGQKAIAVGAEGTILVSDDGGARWRMQTLGSEHLHSVAITPNGRHVIAAGNDGTVLVSEDGGVRWREKSQDRGSILSVAIAADGQKAIAVGAEGTILVSNDGGASWRARARAQRREQFSSVAITADGRHAIAVGFNVAKEFDRTMLVSDDGGAHWRAQTQGSGALNSVAIAANGRHAIAVGNDGTMLISDDGGAHWRAQTQGSGTLNSVAIAADGRRAIAVGSTDWILASNNAGEGWRRLTNPMPHRQYPAPWVYLAASLCAIWLWWCLQAAPATPDEGASAIAASDAPAQSFRDDRLGFTPLARGISRFLRHERTQPPLTLAITADWGRGKSTLMKLVCEDLARCGWRAVWFNAWHHQTEDQMLPALLDAIRREALPGWLSWEGLRFRVRLLWARSKAHFAMTAGVILLAVWGGGFLFSQHAAGTLHMLAQNISNSSDKGLGAVLIASVGTFWHSTSNSGVLAAAAALAIALAALVRQLQPFGLDPSVLLANTLNKVRMKDMSAQTSFRTRFAREFGEVTRALPHPVAIVIDDLDRCQPAAVLQIMEAVNFLMNSGRCYVIFGMASNRVLASLALSFKDIARELAEFDGPSSESGASQDAIEREKRHRYARDYLEKLINIEVVVPRRPDLAGTRLVAEADEDANPRARRVRWFEGVLERKVIPGTIGLGFVAAACFAFYLGHGFEVAPAEFVQAQVTEGPQEGSGADDVPDDQKPEPPPTDDHEDPPQGSQAYQDATGLSWLWALGAVGVFGVMLAFLMLRRLVEQDAVVTDSEAFRKAWKAWLPVVAATNDSPRSVKRFSNRVRYLCMLQQGESVDNATRLEKAYALGERLVNRVRRQLGYGGIESDGADRARDGIREAALQEHRVVALGAMEAIFGEDWKYAATNGHRKADSTLSAEFLKKLTEAIEVYKTETHCAWPPSTEELDAFSRTLRGIRLSGDPQRLATSSSPIEDGVASRLFPQAETPWE